MDWAALVRWAGYLGLFGVTGLAGSEAVIARASSRLPEPLAAALRRQALRWGAIAAWLALLAAVGRLLVQVSAASDPSEPFTETFQAVLGSRWASHWMWQVAAAVIAIALSTNLRRRMPPLTAPLGAAFLAFTLPLTGHAMDFPLGAIAGVMGQGLHVLATSLWIGTLGMLLLSATGPVRHTPPEHRRATTLALVAEFSPMALRAAVTAVLAGVALAIANVRTVDALLHSAYGQMLLRKLFFVGGTAVLGAYNWRRVLPALNREDASPRLLRSALTEVTLAAVILVFTALLSATEAPGIH
jgi:copper transport protein